MAKTGADRRMIDVGQSSDGSWEVRERGARRGFACATRDEAVAEAHRIAAEARLAQVRVREADGSIGCTWLYAGRVAPDAPPAM